MALGTSMNVGPSIVPSYGASDHYTGTKGETYFAWQSGAGDFLARINSHKFAHHVRPEHTVVDFGCGGGFLLSRLVCQRRIGVEINPVAREHALSRGIECVVDADELPDDVADIILTDHALEHVPFPVGALRTLRTKLKRGGLLLICVPIDNWEIQRSYDPKDINHHLYTWTPQLMGNMLAEAGYEVRSAYARICALPGRWTVAAYGRLPYPVFRTVCWCYGMLMGRGREVLAVATRA